MSAEVIFNERGSKGFGFVTFSNGEDATKAKEDLNGKVMDGRRIEVKEWVPWVAATEKTNQLQSVHVSCNVNVLSSSKAVSSQRLISLQEWRVGVEPEEGKGREGKRGEKGCPGPFLI